MKTRKHSTPIRMRVALDVFVSQHCWQCPEARALAEEMQREFPSLRVTVIDLDQPDAIKPASVFAVPTFLINSKVASLGTPTRDQLRERIRKAITEARNGHRKNRIPALE